MPETFDPSDPGDVRRFRDAAVKAGTMEKVGVWWRDKGTEPGRTWNVEHVSGRYFPVDVPVLPVYRLKEGSDQ